MAKHAAHKSITRPKVSKAGQKRVSKKISHLHKAEPEMPHKKMVAMALSMERAHRLGPKGAYKPVRKAAKGKKK